jgi:tol-pal system protein YbgF
MAARAGVGTGTGAARAAGLLLAAALLLAGCETTPPGPDPTQVKLDDLETRLARVERVISNQSLVELSSRIEILDTQLRQLRGAVEELQNSQAQLVKQQRDLYGDLDRRIAALESAAKNAGPLASSGASAPVAPGDAAAAPVSDQAAYEQAFDALKAGSYDSAITQFRDFLSQHPQSSLADNAQYWLGEAYYVTRDFDDAVVAFRTVGQRYPQSRKVPDALVKLGFSQYEQKHLVDARATLALVVQRYPGTDAAKLAADRLARMPPSAGP